MAKSPQYGAFVPTTNVWDVAQIQSADVNSPEFKELLVRLYQNVNNIANILNIKDTGLYDVTEFVNGQKWFANPNNTSASPAQPALRQDIRKVFLRNAVGASDTFDHYITVTPATTFTRIYGVANDIVGFNYYPIPWASAAGATNIEIKVNATQIVITNNSTITFATVYVVLEYLQS